VGRGRARGIGRPWKLGLLRRTFSCGVSEGWRGGVAIGKRTCNDLFQLIVQLIYEGMDGEIVAGTTLWFCSCRSKSGKDGLEITFRWNRRVPMLKEWEKTPLQIDI